MIEYAPLSASKMRLYTTLLRLRPAQLGALVKGLLGIRRRYVRSCDGARFWVDPVSVFGLNLMRDGVYEPQLTALIRALLRPGDVFLDVGGNEGYFSIIAATQVAGGAVHYVEPQARLRPVIKENIRINAAHTITIHHLALTDRDGMVKLFLRPSTNTGASSMFRHWKLGRAAQQVPAITLDTLVARHSLERVRLLKIDCEGAESLVIAGGRNVLSQHMIEWIVMEYHPTICGVEACAAAHQALLTAGYVLTKAMGLNLYHIPGFEQQLTSFAPLQTGCAWDA